MAENSVTPNRRSWQRRNRAAGVCLVTVLLVQTASGPPGLASGPLPRTIPASPRLLSAAARLLMLPLRSHFGSHVAFALILPLLPVVARL